MLNLLVWTPAAGSVLSLLSGTVLRRPVGLVSAALPIGIALLGPAPVVRSWAPSIGASYDLSADGLSLVLCVLVSVLALLTLVPERQDRRTTTLVLCAQSALLGVFCARDALLLLVFLGATTSCLGMLEGHRFSSTQWVGFALLSGYFVLCFQLAEAQTGFPTSSIDRFESLVAFPGFSDRAFFFGAAGPLVMMLGASTRRSSLFLASYWVVPIYLLVRLVISVFPDAASRQHALMSGVGLLGLASAALRPRTRLHNAYQGLALLGLFSFHPEGIVAGEVEMAHLGLALAAVASFRPARSRLQAVLLAGIVLIPPGLVGLIGALSPGLLAGTGLLFIGMAYRFLHAASRDALSEARRGTTTRLFPLLGLWLALLLGGPTLSQTLAPSAEKLIRAQETEDEP